MLLQDQRRRPPGGHRCRGHVHLAAGQGHRDLHLPEGGDRGGPQAVAERPLRRQDRHGRGHRRPREGGRRVRGHEVGVRRQHRGAHEGDRGRGEGLRRRLPADPCRVRPPQADGRRLQPRGGGQGDPHRLPLGWPERRVRPAERPSERDKWGQH